MNLYKPKMKTFVFENKKTREVVVVEEEWYYKARTSLANTVENIEDWKELSEEKVKARKDLLFFKADGEPEVIKKKPKYVTKYTSWTPPTYKTKWDPKTKRWVEETPVTTPKKNTTPWIGSGTQSGGTASTNSSVKKSGEIQTRPTMSDIRNKNAALNPSMRTDLSARKSDSGDWNPELSDPVVITPDESKRDRTNQIDGWPEYGWAGEEFKGY